LSLSCSGYCPRSVLAVLSSLWHYRKLAARTALYKWCNTTVRSCPACPFVPVLSPLSCPRCLVFAVRSWLSYSSCPAMIVLRGCPTFALAFWLLWQHLPGALSLLSLLPSSHYPVLAILPWLFCLGSSSLNALFCLSCPAVSVPTVLSSLSYCVWSKLLYPVFACSAWAVQFWMFCSGYQPIPKVIY
jgi:hypothetical protein